MKSQKALVTHLAEKHLNRAQYMDGETALQSRVAPGSYEVVKSAVTGLRAFM